MSERYETAPHGQGALRELKLALDRLHLSAGKPSGREISRRLGGLPSHTTVSAVLRCDRSCKWWQLKSIVEHLNGDVETFHRLWMAVQASRDDDQRSALAVNEFPDEETRNTDEQLKFHQLIPADMGSNCILPHALDDQWVPRSQLRIMETERATLTDLGELRHSVIRREYVRSLITAERIIVNRSFLFRNPVLVAGYTASAESRNAFTELLGEGAIVLFLTREGNPLESGWAKESATARDAAGALESILRSVRARCVRFSWNVDNEQRIAAWNRRFAEQIKGAVDINHGRFLEDVGANSSGDAVELRKRVALLPRLATPDAQVPITRSDLYAEYIVRDPGDIEQGRYDFSKPYVAAIKWLLDLTYNSNLATELRLALTTPADSVHHSTIHVPNFFQDKASSNRFDPARVRAAMMETIQNALFRRDFTGGALTVFDGVTLPQVVTIRRSELWRKYIHAIDELLEEPWLLAHPERGLPYVYRCYDNLIAHIGG